MLREKVQGLLWNGNFFKVIPAENKNASVKVIRDPEHNVRELIGYIPWYFQLPETGKGYEEAFCFLLELRPPDIYRGHLVVRTRGSCDCEEIILLDQE